MTEITDTRLDEQRLELLRRKLAERGLSRTTTAAQQGRAELSDGQRRMWFVQSVDPGSGLLNVCVSYRLTGAVDVERLHQAVDAVARRHPVLRTTYHPDDDGDPHPRVHDDLRPGWAEHDLSGLAGRPRQLRLEVLAQREFSRPFDLTVDSPLRITAVRLGDDELMLLLTAHHIAWDDGSWAPFFADLNRAYAGPDTELPPLPVPAAAGSADQLEEDLAYWRALMTELPEPLELPGPDGSVVPSSPRAQRVSARISGGDGTPGGSAGPAKRRQPLHGAAGRVLSADTPLHPSRGLPDRDAGAQPRRWHRRSDRLLRQHRGSAGASPAASKLRRTACRHPRHRRRRVRPPTGQSRLAGARVQPGPPPRRRADDAGELRHA